MTGFNMRSLVVNQENSNAMLHGDIETIVGICVDESDDHPIYHIEFINSSMTNLSAAGNASILLAPVHTNASPALTLFGETRG